MFQSFPVSDEAANAKRKRNRLPKACQPCRLRKLRCDFKQPCDRCVKREHESLCVYGPFKNGSRSDSHPDTPWKSSISPQDQSQHTISPHGSSNSHYDPLLGSTSDRDELLDLLDYLAENVQPVYEHEELTGETAYYGRSSMLACFRSLCDWLTIKGHGDFLPPNVSASAAFCLSNRTPVHPFGSLWKPTADVTLHEIAQVLPNGETCLRYYQSYQNDIQPWRPFISRTEVFERRLCEVIENKRKTGDASGDAAKSELLETPKYFAWFGLFFAVLAAGCWFSDGAADDRVLTARVFVASSFECLRLANLYISPSPETVEALLLLVYVIGNDSNPGVTWSLLANATRHAQSIGLASYVPSHPTWRVIIQMDGTLSMAYDRPPISSLSEGENLDKSMVEDSDISNADTVHLVQCIKLRWQRSLSNNSRQAKKRSNLDLYIRKLRSIDAAIRANKNDAANFIRRRSEQEDLIMRNSHLLAEFTRHAALSKEYTPAQRRSFLHETIAQLRAVVEAFVSLQRLSPRSFRAWVMVHLSLSSATMLGALERAAGQYRSRQAFTSLHNTLASVLDGQDLSEEAVAIALAPYAHGMQTLKRTIETYPQYDSP